MIELRATGQVVKFDGFLALYQEGQDETPTTKTSAACRPCRKEKLEAQGSIAATQHFTEPPPRFLRSLAGQTHGRARHRPALDLCLDPAGAEGPRLCRSTRNGCIREDKGRVVVAFLENFFARYVEYDFTAALEEQLDRISNNEISWQQVLEDFWGDFIGAVNEIKDLRVTQVLDALDDCWGRTSMRRARTAAIPGSARPAAPASSTSRPESSAPSSAAPIIRNAATPVRSPPTAKPAPTASSARIRCPISTSW